MAPEAKFTLIESHINGTMGVMKTGELFWNDVGGIWE
jgi:hypothetical protein